MTFAGCYWVFSIIITACYTGSIIAFVTLPVVPVTIDTIEDLIYGFYRIGTLGIQITYMNFPPNFRWKQSFEFSGSDGWQYWFSNSSDAQAESLLSDLELVNDIDEGLGNVTQAWLFGFAFLSSRQQLEYIIQNNLSLR